MSLQTLTIALLQQDRELFDTLRSGHWPKICTKMLAEAPDSNLQALLRSRWVESGARIRAYTADDALLARALRAWLPPYIGPNMVLFRGESVARHEAGHVGFCWTPQRETAEMFASGLQADFPGGGCLLRCEVPADAIVTPPDAHSRWLDEEEYVVDPSMLPGVAVVARFPRPAH